MIRFVSLARALAFVAALLLPVYAASTHADSLAVVDPLPPGPYAVGCSNIAQDFSRVQPGESAQNYWEGYPDGSRDRYVTQLLSDPADALVVNVTVPDDRELYTNRATTQVPFALLVCYPTSADNPYPDYPLPSGMAVPHMQQGSQPPIFADANALWPVLLFSHGLVGSPISSDYIAALTVLASYGYVVVAPFHGDPRFTDVSIDNLSDFLYALLHFRDLRRNAGAAPAVAVPRTRLSVRASTISRPSRRQPRRRFRREPGRRVAAADDRSQADDHRRHVVEAGARRSAAQGDRRLRAVPRAAVLSRVRTRSERARRHSDAIPRDIRRRRPDRAGGDDATRASTVLPDRATSSCWRASTMASTMRAPATSSPGR